MASRLVEPEVTQDAEYTVVARRYRPQQFADLVGQEPVAQALTNALISGRVAHAYLFTGARGTGKTSTARILAKALNCKEGPTPTPCDKCEICLSIISGDDMDVLEIDGASNRGIDEIRAIRQNIHTRPSRSRYKIYIIDEVHMLTKDAFNALLKTLEEPPSHVKFIFATTEVQKIPITILSRCQRFDFSFIHANRIVQLLQHIVETEGMQADDDALQMVARRAGGSMRDAQSLLDQLLAFGSERLTATQVHNLLGTAADDRVTDLAAAILSHDAAKALELVAQCSDEGLQLGELLDQMVEYWRSLMLVSSAGPDVAGLHVTDRQRKALTEQTQLMSLDTILAGLDVLTTTKTKLRNSNHALVLIEMAVIRLSRLEEMLSVPHLVQLLAQPGADLSSVTAKMQVAQGATLANRLPAQQAPRSLAAAAAEVKKKPLPVPEVNGNGKHHAEPSQNESNVEHFWPKVLSKFGGMLIGELSKGTFPAIIGPKALVIRFAPRYHLGYDYCRDANVIQKLEAALKAVTGEAWTIRMEVDENAVPVGGHTISNETVMSAQEIKREALNIPLLKRIVDSLGGNLLKVDPGFGAEAAVVANNGTEGEDDPITEGVPPEES